MLCIIDVCIPKKGEAFRFVRVQYVPYFDLSFAIVCRLFNNILFTHIYHNIDHTVFYISFVLIVSFDSIAKNSLYIGLIVSCHNFRRVSNESVLLGLASCGGCWIGGVLQPFGQRCLRPFLVCFHNILPFSRAYSILDYLQSSISLSVFGLSVQFLGLPQKLFGVWSRVQAGCPGNCCVTTSLEWIWPTILGTWLPKWQVDTHVCRQHCSKCKCHTNCDMISDWLFFVGRVLRKSQCSEQTIDERFLSIHHWFL